MRKAPFRTGKTALLQAVGKEGGGEWIEDRKDKKIGTDY